MAKLVDAGSPSNWIVGTPIAVTHPQKSANLRPVHARYPVPQSATRSPCDSRECKQVAACGSINASGQIDTQALPERRAFQFGAAASKSPIDFAIQISRSKSESFIDFSTGPPAPPSQPPHRQQWPGRA